MSFMIPISLMISLIKMASHSDLNLSDDISELSTFFQSLSLILSSKSVIKIQTVLALSSNKHYLKIKLLFTTRISSFITLSFHWY